MKTYLGETGLNKSWQEPFEPMIKCGECGGEARILFVGAENERGEGTEFVCGLRENGGKGGYWPHDAIACAVYLCRECFKASAILNQA